MRELNITSEVKKLIRMGLNEEQILKTLSVKLSSSEELLKAEIANIVKLYPDFKLIQNVIRSKVIFNKDDARGKALLVNPAKMSTVTFDKTALKSLFSDKYDLRGITYNCEFNYMPFQMQFLVESDHHWLYNTYVPPFWQKEHFFTNGLKPIPKVDKLPKLYHRFFKHLVGNNEPSYNYLINWLANALQDRNYCILTTIGAQGIGKGILGDIMSRLVGSENYCKTDNRLIDGNFNGQIANKRIVYLDEIHVKKTTQENKLKDLINDYLEIEKKGADAQANQNYASIYISSNNLDALRITADDRRYSIIDLTDEKLYNLLAVEEISELLEESNIEQLAYYLYYHKVPSQDMLKVFRNTRAIEIRENQLNEWQAWFCDEYCYSNTGKELTLKEAREAIQEEFGSNIKPGRTAFVALGTLVPERFEVVQKRITEEVKGRTLSRVERYIKIKEWTELK